MALLEWRRPRDGGSPTLELGGDVQNAADWMNGKVKERERDREVQRRGGRDSGTVSQSGALPSSVLVKHIFTEQSVEADKRANNGAFGRNEVWTVCTRKGVALGCGWR